MADLDAVETVTVDSYTTLVDVDSQAVVLAERVPGLEDPGAVSRTWRSRAIQYTMVANAIDAYRPFSDLLGLALDYALRRAGHEVESATREAIQRTVYEDRLAVFEDVGPGLARIADAGHPVWIVSNGDPRMLGHLVEAADLEDVVEDAVSADEVERYKPEPTIYRHAAARADTPVGRVLHVSGGTMRDVWGAKHAGMRTAWLCRPSKPFPRESLGPEPDLTVESFHDLADRLT